MAKDVAALANALRREAPPAPPQNDTARNYYTAPSRAGKLHMSAWLSPAFKSSLLAIRLKHPEKNFQDLYIEALNDLFTKYNVPVVRED